MKQREQLGFFEEFLMFREGCTPKGIGSLIYRGELPKEQQGRKFGFEGRKEFTITSSVVLNKGHKQVTYKASPNKPIRVVTMLQRLEGREL